MRKISLPHIFWSFIISLGFANAQIIHSQPETAKDTSTLGYFFGKGRFYGHARSYVSGTINEGSLTDYHAWVIGAGIGYQTPRFLKRFQVGVSGFFMFNIETSDLLKPDPSANQPNRYEIGLFNIERPNDYKDLDRLEELFLKTHLGKKSVLVVGRQVPQTPFINPHDGRMRPTLVESAVLDLNEWKNLSFHAEYIWRMSPRSTMRWFDIGQTIGLYPVGLGIDGKPSQYKNNLESKGILIGGVTYQKNKWNIQFWDTYVENILNTSHLKIEWKTKPFAGKNWLLGAQYTHQQRAGDGGNPDPAKTYVQSNAGADVFSGRVGQQSPRFDWFLNGTRITARGRYLLPREWGKEPFYTFMPRERNEGFGDLTAVSVNTFFKPRKNIRIEISGGYFKLPDVSNVALNKYAMPPYSQLNLSFNYQFGPYLKGLNAQLLIVRKDYLGNDYLKPQFVFNKVNMTHLNLIINYYY